MRAARASVQRRRRDDQRRDDGVHAHEEKHDRKYFTKGAHPIQVDYFQGGGDWTLTVDVAGPKVLRQPAAGLITPTAEVPQAVESDSRNRFELNPALAEKGQQLFAKNQCNSCHPAGSTKPSNPDPANWGPDLSMAQKRLKGPWIHDWLKNPQASQPGTKMPSFFGEMKDGQYSAFVQDWEEQVRALQHYLKHMDAAQEPEQPVSMEGK